MTDGFFKDWPCLKCLVRAACCKNCDDEHKWFSNLSIKNKNKYLRSDYYRSLPGNDRLELLGETCSKK